MFKKISADNTVRPEGKTALLVFGFDNSELSLIKQLADSLDISEIIEVKKENIFSTLEDILNNKENISSEQSTHSIKTIVFNAASGFELNTFINRFKLLGIESPLFAVVTETSKKWRFHDLIDDLLEEKEMFEQRAKMKKNKNQ